MKLDPKTAERTEDPRMKGWIRPSEREIKQALLACPPERPPILEWYLIYPAVAYSRQTSEYALYLEAKIAAMESA